MNNTCSLSVPLCHELEWEAISAEAAGVFVTNGGREADAETMLSQGEEVTGGAEGGRGGRGGEGGRIEDRLIFQEDRLELQQLSVGVHSLHRATLKIFFTLLIILGNSD